MSNTLARVPPAIATPPSLEVIHRGVVAEVMEQLIHGIIGGQRGRVVSAIKQPLPFLHDCGEFRERPLVQKTLVACD